MPTDLPPPRRAASASALGIELFRRAGRKRELTEAGRSILNHAEHIFTIGDELLEVLHGEKAKKTLSFPSR